jgi:predicted RecB family endonuclease
MKRPEQAIQRAVVQHLTARGVRNMFFMHVPNGGFRSAVEAAIFKSLGLRAGTPDIIAIKDGKCYALELKAPGGRLTDVQRDAQAALAAAGAEVATAVGIDEALTQLQDWKLLRGSCQ